MKYPPGQQSNLGPLDPESNALTIWPLRSTIAWLATIEWLAIFFSSFLLLLVCLFVCFFICVDRPTRNKATVVFQVSRWLDKLFPDVSYPSCRLSGALDRLAKKAQGLLEMKWIHSCLKFEDVFDLKVRQWTMKAYTSPLQSLVQISWCFGHNCKNKFVKAFSNTFLLVNIWKAVFCIGHNAKFQTHSWNGCEVTLPWKLIQLDPKWPWPSNDHDLWPSP